MPFEFLKNLAKSGANRFSGQTDFLEAVCAASALIAFADGSADDSEVIAATRSVAGNASLTSAFASSEIERTMDRMMERAKSGRTGRLGLYKEIDDIASDRVKGETVLAVALDVADEGGISAPEQQVINTIAGKLGIDASKLL